MPTLLSQQQQPIGQQQQQSAQQSALGHKQYIVAIIKMPNALIVTHTTATNKRSAIAFVF